jgi:Phenylalanyl-tRNA synthetase alpha subunit
MAVLLLEEHFSFFFQISGIAHTVPEPYNFNALGADQRAGALHPLNKVRQEFRFVHTEPTVAASTYILTIFSLSKANLFRDGLYRDAYKPIC